MKKEKGITLIALVITIIILLILAGITISQLIGSGLFEKAKLAKNRTKEAEKIENQRLSEYETQINGLGGGQQEDTLSISSKDIAGAEDKSRYYGKIVNGYTCENSEGIENWLLLYADDENIYLISSNLIEKEYVPKGRNGVSLKYIQNNNLAYYRFDDVMGEYEGTDSITNEKIKKLNSEYVFENCDDVWLTISYILDEVAWSSFSDNNFAEYAVGAPSLEIISKSYEQLYGEKTLWEVDIQAGYKVSGEMFICKNNFLYTPEKNSRYFLASPVTYNAYGLGVYDYYINDYETITDANFWDDHFYSSEENCSFRPMVCLKSDVKLIEEKNGTLSISK